MGSKQTTKPERSLNAFCPETFAGISESAWKEKVNVLHYAENMGKRNDAYGSTSLPEGETDRRNSFAIPCPPVNEKSYLFKKGGVLKEQTNYPDVDELWLQQKKYSIVQQSLRNLDIPGTTEQCKGYGALQCGQFQNLVGSGEARSKNAIAADVMGINHIPHQSKEQSSYMSEVSHIVASSPSSMHISKTYGVLTPQTYVADIGYSGRNVCGGDSLVMTAMSHAQHPAKWNAGQNVPHNLKFCSDQKYDTQCCQNKQNLKIIDKKTRTDMNASEVSQSTTKALNQRSVKSNLLSHSLELSQGKGISQIALASQVADTSSISPANVMNNNPQGYNLLNTMSEKERRYNTSGFKHGTAWVNLESSNINEQHTHRTTQDRHQAFDSSYCIDCHSSTKHHSHSPYELNPVLPILKEHSMSVKQEPQVIHPHRLPLVWDKHSGTFDKMTGNVYKSNSSRDQYYLKPPPVDLDDLSDDERERMRVKRERNRVAAAKCRNRRRELLERLEKEAEQLEREQEVLRDNVKKLQAQKRKLGTMLDKHEPACANKLEENASITYPVEADSADHSLSD